MSERLDRLIDRLARSATDRPLDHFEAQVSRGVAQWRAQARARAALAPVRLASIVLALALGVTAGGVAAAAMAARPPGAFSVGADLAPSTLLDGR
jgi:hypothetical protein